MLKNKSWIVALLLAVAFIFSGCLDALPTDDGDDGDGADGSYLMIAGRNESWATIDVKLSEGNLDKLTSGKSHNVTFIGKANPADSLNLGQGLAPYSGGTFVGDYTVPASGNFTISGDVAWADAQTQNVRLGVPQATDPFYVYDVIVKDEDGKVIFQMSKDTAIQGMAMGEPFLLDDSAGQHAWLKKSGTPTITIVVPDAYNAVTGIDGVKDAWLVGAALTLPLQPNPADFEGNIVWSIKAADTTAAGAALSGDDGNILNTTGAGKVTLTATVAAGVSETEAYVRDFVIEVRDIVAANRVDYNIDMAVIQGPASAINLTTYGSGNNKVELVKVGTANFGFRFIQGANYGPAPAFKMTLAPPPPYTPDENGVVAIPSLADFASISFTVISERGDVGWKAVQVRAGTSLDNMVRIDTAGGNAVGGPGVHFHTYLIDAGATAQFDGADEIWLSFYVHGEATGGQNGTGVPTSYIYGNISLNPRKAIGSNVIATPVGWNFTYAANNHPVTGSPIAATINPAANLGSVSNIIYWSFVTDKFVGSTTAPSAVGNYFVTFNTSGGSAGRAVSGMTVMNAPGNLAEYWNGRPATHNINAAP